MSDDDEQPGPLKLKRMTKKQKRQAAAAAVADVPSGSSDERQQQPAAKRRRLQKQAAAPVANVSDGKQLTTAAPPVVSVTVPEDAGDLSCVDDADEHKKKKKAPKPPVDVLYEEIDLREAAALLDTACLKPDLKWLLWFMYKECNQKGGVKVCYRYSKRRKDGRKYADRGMQGAIGSLRRRLWASLYRDIDMENSTPVLLSWLCTKLGMSNTNWIGSYAGNKRNEMLAEVAADLHVPASQAKLEILRVFHGARTTDGGAKISREMSGTLYNLVAAIAACCKFLKPFFPRFVAMAGDEKKAKANLREEGETYHSADGALVHYVCTYYESQLMDLAVAFFRREGWRVGCLVFDGLTVRRKEAQEETVTDEAFDDLLTDLALECKDHVFAEPDGDVEAPELDGLCMRWVQKSLEPREGDMLSLTVVPPRAMDGGFENWVKFDKPEEMQPYLKNTAPAGEEAKWVTQYGLNPLDLEDYRCHVVSALTGLGKSKLARDTMVRLTKAKGRPIRCLWLTGRNIQARSTKRELEKICVDLGLTLEDIVCYDDVTAKASLYDAMVAICQTESAKNRLPKQCSAPTLARYDFLVLDEVVLINDQRVSVATNGNNLRDNDKCIRQLLKDAKRNKAYVLMMDKDINNDPVTREFLLDPAIATQDETKFYTYDYTPPNLERRVVLHASSAKYSKMLKADMLESIEAIEKKDTRAASPVIMCFRSVKELDAYRIHCLTNRKLLAAAEAAKINLEDAIGVLIGGMPKPEIQQIFSDIDGYVKGKIALFYTCTLCVATDIQTTVKRVYIHCGSKYKISTGGPVARILLQMSMRARNVLDQNFQCYFGEGVDNGPAMMREVRGHTAKQAPKPWERDAVFDEIMANYDKKAQSTRSVYARCADHKWAVVINKEGVEESAWTHKNLSTTLAHKRVEVRKNYGYGCLQEFVAFLPLVPDAPATKEELRNLLAKTIRDDAPEDAESEIDEEHVVEDEDLDEAKRAVLRTIDWFNFENLKALLHRTKTQMRRGDRKIQREIKLLETLTRYPGFVAKEAALINMDIGKYDSWETRANILRDINRMYNVYKELTRLSWLRGTHEGALLLDETDVKDAPIRELAHTRTALRSAVKRLREFLELDESKELTGCVLYRPADEQLADKMKRIKNLLSEMHTACTGSSLSSVGSYTDFIYGLNAVLRYIGLQAKPATSKQARKEGSNSRATPFKIQWRRDVRHFREMHEGFCDPSVWITKQIQVHPDIMGLLQVVMPLSPEETYTNNDLRDMAYIYAMRTAAEIVEYTGEHGPQGENRLSVITLLLAAVRKAQLEQTV